MDVYSMMRLGIDTGGTFTDFVLYDGQEITTYKVLSTPDDPARAIVHGLTHLFPGADSFSLPPGLEIVHGTTVATNAFLERKGAKTLLVTTSGFEDVIFIGRQNRAALYDLEITRPPEIVSADQCVGVEERMTWQGEIQQPLAPETGAMLRSICAGSGIESVAVCLLNSYINPDHEEKVAVELAEIDLPLTLSCRLLPEFREYERTSTTLINAYLGPVVSGYIARLCRRLGSHSLYIQQSNGGVLPADGIGERAVHTLLSGPAGGVQGAWQLAGELGINKIITFDMGGTSTDVSLCENGPLLTRDYVIDQYPVRTQVIDIHTVGAGGGSLAHIDDGGLIHVGPASAGADPGPVCYGRGHQLTVTDANIFLGRLLPENFLGGRMELEPGRVCEKMKSLGAQLGLSANQVALGIIRIVNMEMVKAVRKVSLERGHDPQQCAMFSFGGSSGLHCCELARELGVGRVIIPGRAGILSAQGMIMADPVLEASKAVFLQGREIDIEKLNDIFSSLVNAKMAEFNKLCHGGELRVDRSLDIRYQGQSHELTVEFSDDFVSSFHQLHERYFGYSLVERELELVSIRCRLTMQRSAMALPIIPEEDHPPLSFGLTPVIFPDGMREVALVEREQLRPGQKLAGPALIIDDYTTIMITDDFRMEVDSLANLVLTRLGDG